MHIIVYGGWIENMDKTDAIELSATFGLVEVEATLKIDEETVAKIWYKQDQEVIMSLRRFMEYATKWKKISHFKWP